MSKCSLRCPEKLKIGFFSLFRPPAASLPSTAFVWIRQSQDTAKNTQTQLNFSGTLKAIGPDLMTMKRSTAVCMAPESPTALTILKFSEWLFFRSSLRYHYTPPSTSSNGQSCAWVASPGSNQSRSLKPLLLPTTSR